MYLMTFLTLPLWGGGGTAQLISLSVFVSFPPTMFSKLSIQKKKKITDFLFSSI